LGTRLCIIIHMGVHRNYFRRQILLGQRSNINKSPSQKFVSMTFPPPPPHPLPLKHYFRRSYNKEVKSYPKIFVVLFLVFKHFFRQNNHKTFLAPKKLRRLFIGKSRVGQPPFLPLSGRPCMYMCFCLY
jgi:hypothetical protein